ncbi:hypothetical protein GCM10022239_04920 [Leifsonia bigeumensis]|uniref:Integral membrane protein n=1 Tax=Leifsonella bigeumensis TaxID=433643 RepID=A0ABP7F4T1_9MICO
MSETGQRQPAERPRRKWDGYRRISAWAGLVEALAVVVIVMTLGHNLTGGQDEGTTWAIIVLLAAPAVLAGLVSGSRFFALYAGYAQRLDPTAELSAADSAGGAAAASSVIGDGLWGSLFAGLAGSIPATFALSTLFGLLTVIMMPVFVLVIGIAWFAGWTIGAVASLFFSTAIGIAVGAGRRKRIGERLPWMLVAGILPALLVAVVIPAIGTRFADGRIDVWGAILATAGVPVEGAEFVLGGVLQVIVVVAIWLTALLFAAIVVVGTPALVQRRGRGLSGEQAES